DNACGERAEIPIGPEEETNRTDIVDWHIPRSIEVPTFRESQQEKADGLLDLLRQIHVASAHAGGGVAGSKGINPCDDGRAECRDERCWEAKTQKGRTSAPTSAHTFEFSHACHALLQRT